MAAGFKEFNRLFGRPILNLICGYEFAALNSGGRLRAITNGIWWLRDHKLGWLAWTLVVPFLGWAGFHLLMEQTNPPAQRKGRNLAVPSPPLGGPPKAAAILYRAPSPIPLVGL